MPTYADAHLVYRAAGWTGPLPLPDGAKWPPPDGFTGWHGAYPSGADSQTWIDDYPEYRSTRQLALRMPDVVIGIDVDHYGDKRGADTLAEAERRWGPLPAAPVSSARGDGPSGIRFFTVPAGTVLRTRIAFPELGLGDIEIIQRHHRYAVAWPSQHPNGQDYLWYRTAGPDIPPQVANLLLLPDTWIDGLAGTGEAGEAAADPETVAAFARDHAGGTKLHGITGVLAVFECSIAASSRHDAMLSAACMAAREARRGDYPAADARAALRDRFTLALAEARPGQRLAGPAESRREFESAWAWAVSQALAEPSRPASEPSLFTSSTLQRATVPAAAEHLTAHARVTPPDLRLVGDGEPGYDPEAAAERLFGAKVRAEQERRQIKRLVDELERPPAPAFDTLAVWDDALDQVPAPVMAIKHLIPERAVGWLGGPSGSYKSFVAVSLAACLAYGVPALEHHQFTPRQARKVLYVAGEGAAGVALRLRALRARLEVARTGQIALYPRAVDLTSEAAVERMAAFVLEHQVEYIVIDTFRQSTIGVNENDNTEVGLVLSRLLALRDEHGIGSMLVDHTNKSAQGLADLGGAGAKRANADYVLMVDLPNGSRAVSEQRTLRVAKLKDSPDGQTWPIRLEQVDEVTDGDGVPSAVAAVGAVAVAGDMHGVHDWHLVPNEDLPAAVTGLRSKFGAAARDIYRVLSGVGEGLTVAQVAAVLKEGPRPHSKSALYGAVRDLDRDGVVDVVASKLHLGAVT